MITFSYYLLNEPYILQPDKINIFSVENHAEFYELVNNFNNAININLFDGDKLFNLDNDVEFLLSPFSIDYSSKKIQNLLTKVLENQLHDNDNQFKFNNLNSLLENLIIELTQNINLPIAYNEMMTINDIIKVLSVKIKQDNKQKLLPQLIDYINVFQQLKTTKLFVFSSMRQYLPMEQSKQLLAHCIYNQANVLFIEPTLSSRIENHENVIVVDNDLCDFIAK